MFHQRLTCAIALVFLVILILTPLTPTAAARQDQSTTYESPTSPMDLPWGG